jgi:hypothetical protein
MMHGVVVTGYATASVEGRIAVEYFDPSPAAQEKKYAFKCHRQTIDEVDHVWPVNALAFHPYVFLRALPDPLFQHPSFSHMNSSLILVPFLDTLHLPPQALTPRSPSGTTR